MLRVSDVDDTFTMEWRSLVIHGCLGVCFAHEVNSPLLFDAASPKALVHEVHRQLVCGAAHLHLCPLLSVAHGVELLARHSIPATHTAKDMRSLFGFTPSGRAPLALSLFVCSATLTFLSSPALRSSADDHVDCSGKATYTRKSFKVSMNGRPVKTHRCGARNLINNEPRLFSRPRPRLETGS